jgi:hypothetical protein
MLLRLPFVAFSAVKKVIVRVYVCLGVSHYSKVIENVGDSAVFDEVRYASNSPFALLVNFILIITITRCLLKLQ